MTTVINTSTSFHLRVSKSPIGKKQHIYERKSHETKMADFNLRGVAGKKRHTGYIKNTDPIMAQKYLYAAVEVPDDCKRGR